VIHNGLIYFGFENGSILGFDLKTGEVKVDLQADDSASIKSGLIVDKDVLYFGDWNGKIYAFDLKEKKRLWKYDSYEKQEYPTFGQINTELTVYKDLLFFGARNPEFQAVDIKSSSKKWSFVEEDGGWISGDPLIHNDTLFVAGSDNHKLLALDPVTGSKFWEYEFLFNNFSKPVIYKDFILFTTGDAYSVYGKSKGFGYLYALNRKDGSIVNFAHLGGNLNSTPVMDKENLFVCSEDGFVYKVNIELFLEDSDHLSDNGYRAFDVALVDSESDSEVVKIDYKVNYDSHIEIRVTDISDNEIQLVHDGKKESGEHSLLWDKLVNGEEMIQPGYYFVEISSGDSVMKTFFKIEK
jgi:outer membrane protein assembly factor BamB